MNEGLDTPSLSTGQQIAVNVSERSRDLLLWVLQAAEHEAFLEWMLAEREMRDPALVKKWQTEWGVREECYKTCSQEGEAEAPSAVRMLDSSRLFELSEACTSEYDAFTQFCSAVSEGNVVLMGRWRDEWRSRNAYLQQQVVKFLTEYAV